MTPSMQCHTNPAPPTPPASPPPQTSLYPSQTGPPSPQANANVPEAYLQLPHAVFKALMLTVSKRHTNSQSYL